MKILCVSLLRLGDAIQHRALIAGIRKKYPDAEIHLLLNEEFSSHRDLFPDISKFHFFPRQALQTQTGNAKVHILGPVLRIREFNQNLKHEMYSVVYNFTHNSLSAMIIESLDVGVSYGLVSNGSEGYKFANEAMRYFNDVFPTRIKSHFHYLEYLAFSLDLELNPPPRINLGVGGEIGFQVLSSDSKKNWSLQKWRELKNLLLAWNSGLKIKILGSSLDREKISKYFSDEEMDFSPLSALEEKAKSLTALVTMDTSTMHLLAARGVPIVEIALGSADPGRTGPWQTGSRIISARSECFPCSHRQDCKQSSHLCSESISAEAVFVELKNLLTGMSGNKNGISYWGPLGWTLGQDAHFSFEKAFLLGLFGVTKNSDLDFPLDKIWLTSSQKRLENSLNRIISGWRDLLADYSPRQVMKFQELVHEILGETPDLGGYFASFEWLKDLRETSALNFIAISKKAIERSHFLISQRREFLNHLEEKKNVISTEGKNELTAI